MLKINKKSFLLIAIALIIVLSCCLILFTLGNSYAGSYTAGAINYNGAQNKCEYNLVVSADIATDHVFSALGFKVQMIGVYCKRNVFTTFQYLINFKLFKDNKEIKSHSTTFKITKSSQITEDSYQPIIFESSALSGAGTYTLKWSGSIKSNSIENISGSYTFEIN